MGPDNSGSAYNSELTLKAGDTIIREGDLGDTAYCILDGEVKVWKRNNTGAIELARLGPGSIFGEMSLVDEKPRSASITALVDTRLKEVKRDQFLESFQHDPEFATSLLRVLFERLRETGAKLTQLQPHGQPANPLATSDKERVAATPTLLSEECAGLGLTLLLEGLTEVARQALPTNPYRIEHLPFRIGRQSSDQLAFNDLELPDLAPYQISVNHLLVFLQHNPDNPHPEIGIFDRGSSLGSRLNGARLGGLMANETVTDLPTGDSELVLGDEDSFFRFRVSLTWA